MAAIDFLVTLRGGETEGELLRFEPGDEIAGSVQLVPNRPQKARRVLVRLQWHTEGRGDRDRGTVSEEVIHQGDLTQGMPISHEFRYRLPQEPWSFSGHYVNIVWSVAVVVDVALAADPNHLERFIMAPAGWR